MSFLSGSDSYERIPTIRPSQEPIFEQRTKAAQGKGAGGAYGTSADYYYNNLSDDPETLKQLSAPEMRRFNEEIIPGLSEQFAGMGSGGLSSSGFRNAAVNAGTDLSERLGAIRASLRENAARGLNQLGEQSLQPVDQLVHETSPGLLDFAGPALGAVGSAFGGPLLGAASGAFSNWLGQSMKGKSSPYGQMGQSGQNLASQGQSVFRR